MDKNSSAASILLVDDEPANLLALEAVLLALGEPLVRAHSGEQAMRALRDADFAAVLLDVHMPGMDGFETARLIRAQKRSRETPILFITADASDLSSRAAYAIGAVDFLTKPLEAETLKAKLSFFIELHHRRRELLAAERRAVQDRAFLSAVLEAVEDGIVACDSQGRLTLFNRATRDFLGLPDGPVNVNEWPPTGVLFRPDGTPLPASESPLGRALSDGLLHQSELVIALPDRPRRTVLASGQALQDENGAKLGAVISLHDISAWREAESAREAAASEQIRREEAEAAAELLRESRERLRVSEELYRTLFESIDEGFCIIEMIRDSAGRPIDYLFLETNPAFVKHTGMVNALGRRMREFVPDHDEHWFETYGRVADSGESIRFEDEARAMKRWFDVYATRLGGPGSNKVAVFFTDITQRKLAAENLRRLAEELAISDRRKTEFLATLAHELRNPLAPISNGLHLLRMAPGNAQAQERARNMMERQLKHMVHLVDDLLDIARISSNKVELRKEALDLRNVLASAVETSMPLITSARHALDVRLPEQPLPLEADATRIAQVVSNLLNNAAKYTPQGGRIELDVEREGDEAVVRVRDSGIGISAEELPEVFEMFTQVGRNRDRAQGGLGIGLALVQRLVQLHGGSVSAQSDGPGTGSTFTVRLPLTRPAELPVSDGAEGAQSGPGEHRFRIMVVDDNVDAAESLAALLELEGHQTRVAHDGDAALRLAAEFKPQIVFLDIGMPGKDGYQVARELRAMEATQASVLVALTGWGAREDRDRSSAAGFDHHLTKPAGLDAVEALLGSIGARLRGMAKTAA